MSTALPTAATEPQARQARAVDRLLTPEVILAIALSIVGLFAISSTCNTLWAMWMTDPLKSVGGLIPIASLLLILRAWRQLGWSTDGSWWGLAVLAVTIGIVHVRDQAVIEFVLSPSWSIVLPPLSVVAVAYGAGVVLLFGGFKLLRAAWFPVALLWFVNPVPHVFNRYIDLPLQHASAMIARTFAHSLGQQLTPDQLSLMFTPKFGMFIAPGCNGIRGAITMGIIALIAGYLYRLRPRHWALLTISALLLGYVFNFVRLCGLVFYYVIALRYPWLQDRAAMGDYILGACLFFVATILLFMALSRWSPPQLRRGSPSLRESPATDETMRRRSLSRHAVFASLIAAGSLSYARAMVRSAHAPDNPSSVTATLPQHVGRFALQREWNESFDTGTVVFRWAEYVDPAGGPAISLGISPTLGAHDTLLCHAARGEDWIWHGPLAIPTAAGLTNLSASLYNNGATQYLEAASICTRAGCNQSSTDRTHFGFIYSWPSVDDLITQDPARPIPILLRVETSDAALSTTEARAKLTQSLTNFLSGVSLADLTKPYRQR